MSVLYSPAGLQFLTLISYPEIEIKENKFTCITGKSGCGKSTYLRILNRTCLPAAGTVYYHGQKTDDLTVAAYRKKVLLVPQSVFLFDGTIEENFQHYYEARGDLPPDKSEMKKFLHLCAAEFPLHADCRVLSGGERQRVFLAIFLSCMPEVLLLDEPTAALDETTSREVLSNIKNFCRTQEITVVCVCHNDKLVQEFADVILTLGG